MMKAVKINLRKPPEWRDAYIHLWDAEPSVLPTKWPGVRMQLKDPTTNTYVFELPAQRSVKFVLNGGSNEQQTEDYLFEGEECWFYQGELWVTPPELDVGFTFPNGATKAVVLSYDDGTVQDERLVALLDKYGLKGTFHINSGLPKDAYRIPRERIASVYADHEVSVHSSTHPFLYHATYRNLRSEILGDLRRLKVLSRSSVYGLSYPFGSYNLELLRLMPEWGLHYGRVVAETHDFSLPGDLLRWRSTCHHRDGERYIDQFLAKDAKDPALFFMWGHSWEFDSGAPDNNWDYIERLFERLGNQPGIWYATASQVARRLLEYRKSAFRIRESLAVGDLEDSRDVRNGSSIVEQNPVDSPSAVKASGRSLPSHPYLGR